VKGTASREMKRYHMLVTGPDYQVFDKSEIKLMI
jgi:hypothetical protein